MTKISESQDTVVCKATTWFTGRALLMLALLIFFALYFLYDGTWGYREKNLHFYMNMTFVKAGEDFQNKDNQKAFSEGEWKDYSSGQKCVFPEDAQKVLPRDTDIEQTWPGLLIEGYEKMKKLGGQQGAAKLWKQYTAERRWDAEAPEEPYSVRKIREQFIAAGVCMMLILIGFYFLIRTLRRRISADNEALHTQDGRRIPYADMVRIDKRKWDNKGLAFVYYNENGTEKKARIDGMVYGQFKEKDGAPAEKLYNKVMENFRGEIIEYVSLDEQSVDS